jgi:hypothetical protein
VNIAKVEVVSSNLISRSKSRPLEVGFFRWAHWRWPRGRVAAPRSCAQSRDASISPHGKQQEQGRIQVSIQKVHEPENSDPQGARWHDSEASSHKGYG